MEFHIFYFVILILIIIIYFKNNEYSEKYDNIDIYDVKNFLNKKKEESVEIVNTTPIVKQFVNFVDQKIDGVKDYIYKEPIYDKIPDEYSLTKKIGSGKSGKISDNYICPMGEYIKTLEIGSDGEKINYIKGTCSGEGQLEILGKKLNNTNIVRNISEEYGINGVYYMNDDDVTDISNLEGGNIGRKKLSCPYKDHVIVGYRGKADDKISNLQFVCNDKNSQKDLPDNYLKCSNDGDICNFKRNHHDIYYGIPGKKLVKVSKRNLSQDSFTCYPIGFLPLKNNPVLPIEDPIPNEDKACYIENSIYYDIIENNNKNDGTYKLSSF
jgi:hypothetical protein